MIRSPHPHARIVSIDLSEAQKAPGVKAALNLKQAGAEVMYQGDPVAAIAADTEERVNDAARLVKVQYEVLPHVALVELSMAQNAPVVFKDGNTRAGQTQENGDLEAGFKQAAHTVEQTYSTHVITHVCMETHGSVSEWDGDKLTVWLSTQGVHGAANQLAMALGIPQTNVRVITQYMGGGFGSKAQAGAEALMCARLAKAAGVPVKMFMDRKEEHLDSGNRPSATASIKAGVSADGTLTAWDGQTWGTGGPAPARISRCPTSTISRIDAEATETFLPIQDSSGPMRAPGHPQGSYLTEVLMDELADLVKIDPLEFRIKNCPPLAANAMWRSYLAEGGQLFGWDKRHPTVDQTPGPIKTGFGCAVNQWGGGGRASAARCEITPDGAVALKAGTQDIGTGTRTIVAMVTAETLGLPISAITPMIGDTIYPACGNSGGSTTAASVMPPVRLAAGKALDALCAKVGPALGVDAATLVASNGRIHVKDNTSKGMAWKDACKLLGTETIATDAAWEIGMSSTGTSGCQFAEVTVDVETGIAKVKRVLVVQDCGIVMDKLTAESQVNGGVVGSLNFALYEDRILDRNTGQMVNPNMEWYLLAGMSEMPKIEVHLKEQRERGVIGIGEPPTVSTAAAIACAVRNATGATIRSLPLTPQKVLEAMQQQKAGGLS